MTTASYLAEVRARMDAATPGPWTAHDDGLVWPERMGDPVSGSTEMADAEFIAHAREDLPRLLAVLDRVRALADRRVISPDAYLAALDGDR